MQECEPFFQPMRDLSSMNAKILAVALLCLAGVAHAGETGAPRADIARVLSIEIPASASCETVTAVMTYRDSQGEQHQQSYLRASEACLRV